MRPPQLEPYPEAPVLLTCPKCKSGLEVPDGTTAMVRCPACKTVFSATTPPEPEPEKQEEEPEAEQKPKTKTKPPRDEEEDEDEAPKKTKPKAKAKSGKKEEDDEDENEKKDENRDFDPIDEEEERKRKKKRKRGDDELSPEEKAERNAAFRRAAIGVKLIWISFALFSFSMALILIFYLQSSLMDPFPELIAIAGFFGLVNWLLAAVGVGLCLSGPPAPGHWGYGIAAATAVVIHLVLLLALVASGKEFAVTQRDAAAGNERLGLLPTRQNATMFYLTVIAYPENQELTPKGSKIAVSGITGIAEMTRTVLIMMLLSCLSRAALDDDLAHRCTRAAGIVSGGPGLLALLILATVAALVITNAGKTTFTQILYSTVQMGVYAILVALLFPAFMAARDVEDACNEPFQSLIPKL